jgi:hypothetical protein
MIDPVLIDELNNDRRTSLSEQQEAEIKEFEGEAFLEIIEDDAVFCDFLLDLAPMIRQAILDSSDCDPYDKNAKLKDVIFNASCWNSLVSELELAMQDSIKETAQELWEQSQC